MQRREIIVGPHTVRRPRKPWTPTVHALLRHLRAQGLPVPEPLAIDDETEVVSLVPGTDGDQAWPDHLTPEAARSLGTLLRRVHDATSSWEPPSDACWSVPWTASATICHGDPKPGNVTWSDERATGIFDWDAARPGPPISDLAYALLWVMPAPISPLTPVTAPQDARARADALLEGYGWDRETEPLTVALSRHEQAIDEVEWLGAHGHEPHATWVREGWPTRWRQDLRAVRP